MLCSRKKFVTCFILLSQNVLREANLYTVCGLYSRIFTSHILMVLEKILLKNIFGSQR